MIFFCRKNNYKKKIQDSWKHVICTYIKSFFIRHPRIGVISTRKSCNKEEEFIKTRIREKMFCEESAITFCQYAYVPHIRLNHSTFPIISTTINLKKLFQLRCLIQDYYYPMFLKVSKSQKHFFLKLHCPKKRPKFLTDFCPSFQNGSNQNKINTHYTYILIRGIAHLHINCIFSDLLLLLHSCSVIVVGVGLYS